MTRAVWFSVLGLAALSIGCKSGERIDPELDRLGRATGPVDPGTVRSASPPTGGAMSSRGRGAGGGVVHSGEIVETMQVPNYTYMLLETGGGDRVWTAVPRTQVEVGQSVEVVESIVMRDFKSRTLNRTFPTIVFGTLGGGAETPQPADAGLPPGHPPIASQPRPPVE